MDQAMNELAPAGVARRTRAGLRVAIMGAGFAGIGLAILLKKANAIRGRRKFSPISRAWRATTAFCRMCG